MMRAPKIKVLQRSPDIVGEGPLWLPESGEIAWVDIPAGKLRRMPLAGGAVTTLSFDVPPAALARDLEGDLVVAAGTGWHRLAGDGSLLPIATPAMPEAGWRMNDGCVDLDGRFWTGSLAEPRTSGAPGKLFRLDRNGGVAEVDGLQTQNGLAVAPEGTTLYLADSHPEVNTIWAFDLDRGSGRLSNRRVFHRPQQGRVDGAAMDAEGCYWFAGIDAGRITRLAPEGEVLAHIDLPVSRPTKLAFCGHDLKTICVTSMSILPEGRTAADEPLAGAVFMLASDVAGMPVPPVSVLPDDHGQKELQ
ncbi:SMP-30/gluconolactonase/LRE family protein [Martelella lutilitoris]|uniref:SMP-30/gluconolactonase/LRE family protein n=2 Tax=Martelella lutilitoris TaxID=2583532 RepID=A0A5C4JU26_9HYPH|nr:SMP-30/gluconolactonase/LRE family protein [Martelella lutilitoris]